MLQQWGLGRGTSLIARLSLSHRLMWKYLRHCRRYRPIKSDTLRGEVRWGPMLFMLNPSEQTNIILERDYRAYTIVIGGIAVESMIIIALNRRV